VEEEEEEEEEDQGEEEEENHMQRRSSVCPQYIPCFDLLRRADSRGARH